MRRVAEAEVYLAGSPASCVNVALHHLVQDVDLVLSGPNIGHNAGRKAIHSSGTVGAVVEGVLHGTKVLAVATSSSAPPGLADMQRDAGHRALVPVPGLGQLDGREHREGER